MIKRKLWQVWLGKSVRLLPSLRSLGRKEIARSWHQAKHFGSQSFLIKVRGGHLYFSHFAQSTFLKNLVYIIDLTFREWRRWWQISCCQTEQSHSCAGNLLIVIVGFEPFLLQFAAAHTPNFLTDWPTDLTQTDSLIGIKCWEMLSASEKENLIWWWPRMSFAVHS